MRAFKGFLDYHIDFGETETNIFGDNATGKTTIVDAFRWLLVDKDSTGRKDFGIKTLENGVAIPQIDHEVEGVLLVNGEKIELKKVYSEKWTKKRGREESEFSGHETTYFWNGVPMRQKDFQENINGICEEYILRKITNPLEFLNLDWKEKREILMEMAGEVSDMELAGDNERYQRIVKELEKVKNEDEYKAKLRASVKKQKEALALIPARLDECERGKPTPLVWGEVEKQIQETEKEISQLDAKLENSTAAYKAELEKVNAHNRKMHELKKELDSMEFEAEREALKKIRESSAGTASLTDQIRETQRALDRQEAAQKDLTRVISDAEKKIAQLEAEMDGYRTKWREVNASHYNGEENCPTCHQRLPEDEIQRVQDEFSQKKKAELTSITETGKGLAAQKQGEEQKREEAQKELQEKLDAEVKRLEDRIKVLEAERDAKKSAAPVQSVEELVLRALEKNAEYKKKEAAYKAMQAEPVVEPTVDNTEIKEQKEALIQELDRLKIDLSKKVEIEKADQRIKELKAEQKQLSQEVANVDRDIFALEEFMRLKGEEVERRVRSLFEVVSFRMYETLINGSIVQTCIPLVNGVPISDVNDAGKVNAGLDIINALSKFYGVSAPVFLDNRESVTRIIPTDCQIINLIVSNSDKTLRIENK